jgi:hypothetical protein
MEILWCCWRIDRNTAHINKLRHAFPYLMRQGENFVTFSFVSVQFSSIGKVKYNQQVAKVSTFWKQAVRIFLCVMWPRSRYYESNKGFVFFLRDVAGRMWDWFQYVSASLSIVWYLSLVAHLSLVALVRTTVVWFSLLIMMKILLV